MTGEKSIVIKSVEKIATNGYQLFGKTLTDGQIAIMPRLDIKYQI